MQKCKGFTLIEVVIALSLFAIILVGIIFAMYRAYAYVQASKLQLIAINLTREGVEAVYNIRDTNWRKYSGERDKYWLKADPYTVASTGLFASGGLYRLNRNPGSGYSLTWSGANTGTYEMDTFFASLSDVANFKVNFTGNLSGIALSGLMKKEADFYRVVRVFGLYDKLSDPGTLCTSSCKGTDFNTSHPKELRFCVKTFYVSPNAKRGSSELCGMLTNFLE